MNASPIIDLEHLLRIPHVEPDLGYDFSPAGDKVSFSWNKTGSWEIYLFDLNQDEKVPRQLTSGLGGKFSPRWRPGHNALAYALDLDGGEEYDLYLCDLDLDQHQNLTPNTPFAISPEYDWSPDGKKIAFCADRGGHFDVYLLTIKDRSISKIHESDRPDWSVTWSPSGENLAIVSEATGQDNWITIFPLVQRGTPWQIKIGGQPMDAQHPAWSADGRQLLFSSNHTGTSQIAQLDLETHLVSWITSDTGEKERPNWSNNGAIAYTVSKGPTAHIAVQSALGSSPDIFQVAPGVVYQPHFGSDPKKLFFIFDNPQHPCDLWQVSLPGGHFIQLTPSSQAADGFLNLVMPQQVKYPGIDGAPVPALLYLPHAAEDWVPGFTPVNLPPAVVYIHGGPNWLTQVTWDPLVQHMVSRGWVVLAPNYRGSTGYGKAWQLANRFDLGGVDTRDVTAGASFLVNQGIANPKKIALTGRSWGGYLTMTCLTQYPDRWAAGSAVVPFMNWFTAHKNSREDLQHWDLENFGDPETNHALWHERSPYFFLDHVQAPIQLICGANDVRCPASESRAAYEQLINLGKVCEYILYPDEGHAFLQLENVVRSKIQQVDFLSRYLENKSKEP